MHDAQAVKPRSAAWSKSSSLMPSSANRLFTTHGSREPCSVIPYTPFEAMSLLPEILPQMREENKK